ncbi:STT3 domain-containing protein [Thiorhodovibrio frisius]|uniref:Putative membrane protein, required for N-linked glycosylation n=1 Tax=Thiorhodovibrio frisius TaxID=631362 RepID=H8YXH2_9GAMM|nr:STT3 domain-containing protein [Thiorhodovibrio frisius]EIC23148.1 putative membrane protein, required for N-linked glycosylation [Thiorhodovibrio frisius]WPL22581.1 Undecaprenyl-diphosphooligosaccharide--protein glycotransferase [Thiorhodovibrio frisius]
MASSTLGENRILDFRHAAVALGLLMALVAGLFLRIDSLAIWLENPQRYFFAQQTRPLLLGVDGYYYLDIARDLLDGTYQPFDPNRQIPRGFERAATPPLLSVVTAGLARAFTVSLEWIAILLPPVLGALLAVPAFLLGRALGASVRLDWVAGGSRAGSAEIMGLASAFFALLSPFLVSRSGVGWYETDPLNVFFAALLPFLALACGEAARTRRALGFFAAWALCLLLFLWWWDQSEVPVLALAGLPMLVALGRIASRSARSLLPFVIGLVGLALVLGLWKGAELLDPVQYLRKLGSIYRYIGDHETSVFRPTGAAVSEQMSVPLARFARDTAGGWLPFNAAMTGLLGLLIALRYRALYLVALVLVALLSFSAARFMIFAAPLFGLGMGFVAFVIWNAPGLWWWRTGLLGFVLVSMGAVALARTEAYDGLVPRRAPELFDAMVKLREHTPPDAVIWASWGHGHPLAHYADRGTLGDGIYHPAPLQYALNFPLTTADPRLAANWIAFVVAHGVPGLHEANAMLGNGPDDWGLGMARLQRLLALGVEGARQQLLESAGLSDEQTAQRLAFLFPGSTRPTYLFLNDLLLSEAWYVLGRWDFSQRNSPPAVFLPLRQLQGGDDGVFEAVSRAGPTMIDLQRGQIRIGRQDSYLQQATLLDQARLQRLTFHEGHGFSVHLIPAAKLGVYASANTASTLLTQLFFEREYDSRFFTPTLIKLPDYSVWKVEGESSRTNCPVPGDGHPPHGDWRSTRP